MTAWLAGAFVGVVLALVGWGIVILVGWLGLAIALAVGILVGAVVAGMLLWSFAAGMNW